MWLAFAIQIAGIINNRLALAKMRAEMSTDLEEKKKAIDEGLIVADTLHKLLDRARGQIEQLRGDDKSKADDKP